MALQRAIGTTSLYLFDWGRYLVLGMFGLVTPLLLVRDILRVSSLGARRLVRFVRRRAAPVVDHDRRRFLAKSTNAGIVGVSAVLGGVGVAEARGRPRVVEVSVPIRGLPPELEGYRIAQVSDLHIGLTIRRGFLQTVVDAVGELAPDLIAITGDMVDGHVPELSPELEPLRELHAPDGVLFVTGNHEYYWDVEAWVRALPDFGLRVLMNEHVVIERGAARLVVAGTTDEHGRRFAAEHACDPVRALAGAPPSDARILLAHQPKTCYAAARAGYDLQLSGHTHGGQFFPFTLVAGLVHPFVAGLGRLGDLWVYVNRGTGYWGPPLRLGSPPEVTLVRLTAAAV
ncbi:MAG: metallophosphoesterase [Myxococcales bacterium]|nr:metallophosphoesterase [Myxococcales bacterium]